MRTTDQAERQEAAYPALYVVHPSEDSPAAVPPAADITAVVTDGLEDAGWSTPSDIVIDVREGRVEIQDEVPPADPIDWYGVVVVFSQQPATFTHSPEDGPFRVAQNAIHDAYPDLEIWISAVTR